MICQKCNQTIPDDAAFCCYCGKPLQKVRKRKGYHANGEGCAFQRPGMKTWTGRVTDMSATFTDPNTGKLIRKTKEKSGFKTEKAARLWCMQWYAGKREEDVTAPTLTHYWDLYSSGKMEKLSQSKRTAYTIAWGRCRDLHARHVDKITIADLQAVVRENAKSYYTARDMKVLLDHLFMLAAADGFVQKDLPSFIELPKLVEKEAEIFTDLEQAKLWKAYESGNMVAAWPLLMIYTGMMPGETFKLEVPMIDLEKRVIVGAGLKTSTRKAAPIYLPDAIVQMLQDLIGDRTEGKLFRRNKDLMYKDYHELTKQIGIRDLDPYSCRHTAGTALAVTENIAPETVRKIMRWATGSRMISRYSHPTDQDALEAVNRRSRPEAK